MEPNMKEFSGLIDMIKSSTKEEEFTLIAVRERNNKFVYGKMKRGEIANPFQLNVTDTDENNFCQNLYDVLVYEFGEQLCPGYSHSFDGRYEYFMTLADNVWIYFPTGYEYRNWIYNQVQKDNEETKKKTK